MGSKLQFQTEADKVDIEVLWKAMTKDKFEVIKKAAPDLLTEWEILEGDGHGNNIGLGSLLHFSFGAAAPNVAPFKERIVEFDEINHLLSFLGIEGGYMKLGLASYVVSFKFDNIGEGNTMITTTLTYDLEKDFDGTQLLEDLTQVYKYYVNSVVSYLQKNNV